MSDNVFHRVYKDYQKTDFFNKKFEEHHLMSLKLFFFLSQCDWELYDDYFEWRKGGEGDNGEVMLNQLDAFFHTLDQLNEK